MVVPNRASVAYDLDMFDIDAKKSKSTQIAETKIKDKRLTRDNTSPLKILVLAVMICTVFGAVVYGKVKVNEITKKISAEQHALDISISENARLNSVVSSNYSLKTIELIAVEDLGMQKVSKSQIEHLNINSGKLIEINKSNKSDNIFIKVKDSFQKLLEYLGF